VNIVTGTDANKLIIEKVKTYLFLYFRNPCASINLTNLILGFPYITRTPPNPSEPLRYARPLPEKSGCAIKRGHPRGLKLFTFN